MTRSQESKRNVSIKNTESMASKSLLAKKVAKFAIYGTVAIGAGILCSEVALAGAAKFDIDAGITGGTKPVIDGLTAHWGKGVLLTSVAAALLGEGDGKQRAIRAAMGGGSAGVVILGLLALLT